MAAGLSVPLGALLDAGEEGLAGVCADKPANIREININSL